MNELNYNVPRGEEHLIHAVIEIVQYNARTGVKMSVPRVQKFGIKEWKSSIYSSLKKQGYTITILHDGAKWLQEHAEQRASAIAQSKADELAKIKEEAKAELLEELKAQGLISSEKKKDKKAKEETLKE